MERDGLKVAEQVYAIKMGTMKSDIPVFESDVPRKDVVASFFEPTVGQWCADRKSLESGALVPGRLTEGYGIKTLPHVLENACGWVAVSEGVKDAIEALDAGIHGFTREIDVYYKDGRKSEHRYFGLGWGSDLKGTIDVQRSRYFPNNVNPQSANWPKDLVPFYSLGSANAVAVRRAVVEGRHLWRTSDYSYNWFCSEELHAAFKKLKVRGLRYLEQPLV